MTSLDATTVRTGDTSTEAGSGRDPSEDASFEGDHSTRRTPSLDTHDLMTLVRRAPALAALREQPLDRRDLEERLGVSKPTVHRLTKTLGEMDLLGRSEGIFVLTELGETIADVVSEFEGDIESAYRLAPLLESPQYRDSTLDVEAFADATVTTAEPADPYGPLRRYCSLTEETETLHDFETTMFSPQYIHTVHQQVRDGMETEVILPSGVIARMRATYPEERAEIVNAPNFDIRVHDGLPYGLAVFDERIGIGSYSETTGALRTFIDTNSTAAREWAEATYHSYWNEAEPLSK